jgi:drug/metabolite transporter (DMT)-like permease
MAQAGPALGRIQYDRSETVKVPVKQSLSPWAVSALTLCTLVAFAANSVLCRLALGSGAIDAASFATVRLASGAAMLWLLVGASRSATTAGGGTWTSGLMLFLYAVPFSFAYISLSAGTGALILFAAVQGTMIAWALQRGERPSRFQWAGLAFAAGGLVYLVSPGLTAPSPVGSAFMAVAGIAWGIYSVRGHAVADPFRSTAGNFLRAAPFAIAVSLVVPSSIHLTGNGVVLALVSGAGTSGLGYVAWYRALRDLTTTKAAAVQVSVPALTAIGGVIVLSEALTVRLLIASIAVLGGVGMAALTPQGFDKKGSAASDATL